MSNESLIAVIDDDEGMRISLDGLLRSLGHRTALFANAEAFLGSPVGNDIDCVISDIQMPGGMSGLDLAERLSKREHATPVILMSAYAATEISATAAGFNVRCMLSKPFDDEKLIGCLNSALAA